MQDIRFVDEWLKDKNIEIPAIIQDARTISYGELDHYSTIVAKSLSAVAPSNGRVILLLGKSIEAVISIFGILKSGSAYVPIDNRFPVDKILSIIFDCRPHAVILDTATRQRLEEASATLNIPMLTINEYRNLDSMEYGLGINEQSVTKSPDVSIELENRGRSNKNPAYIIYTSGSTGKPKGVMIRHESVISYINDIISISGYQPGLRFLCVPPLHFDAHIIPIFCALALHGTVIISKDFKLPGELLATIQSQRVTDAVLVSSVLKLLATRFVKMENYNLSSLRSIMYGAESCHIDVLRKIKDKIPHLYFIHGYGPTEVTCGAIYHVFENIPDDVEDYMPIGKPLPGVIAYALNDDGKPIAPGEQGELFLGGIQVMQGYFGDHERTGLALQPDHLVPSRQVYRTGDFVTINERRDYIFIGRKDDMVKVQGRLLYLSEVEKALLTVPEVKDAHVASRTDEFGNIYLVAFAVSDCNDRHACSAESVTAALKKCIPQYMIPRNIYIVDSQSVPLTSAGKVDKKKLLNNYHL